MRTPLSRRELLVGSASLATTLAASQVFGGCTTGSSSNIGGGIVGGPWKVGHKLRTESPPPSTRTIKAGVVIVGGGISGLSAAWHLERSGFKDFLLLELHSSCGGNATSGSTSFVRYPWGAHYIPVANKESTYVHELFAELGVIDTPQGGTPPTYNEEHLCGDPQERLFRFGEWQPGIVPAMYLSQRERDEQNRFFECIHDYQHKIGSDGRPAFAIPIDLSSRDEEFLALDRSTFAAFLDDHDFKSASLRWYIEYCCRDDYGCEPHEISAWSGIHYFAGRNGWASNADASDLVTWPEGNGWIVKKLAAKLASHITVNALVHTIEPSQSPFVEYLDLTTNEGVKVECGALIFAGPRFTLPYLVPSLRTHSQPPVTSPYRYNPWMVANLSMHEPPDGIGASMAWDNVVYGAKSLGYVVATHQEQRVYSDRTVLTYYLPLSGEDPSEARKKALDTKWETWRDSIVKDLQVPHPRIEKRIESIDVWLWGHAMITPTPGYIWNGLRQNMQTPLGRMWFAHSDMSGISIFEEAQYRGVEAAKGVLTALRA